MNKWLFSSITCDYYTRQYILNPDQFAGLSVIVYAECSRNTEKIYNHYYSLEIFFSADRTPVRDYIVGTSFGTGPMNKKELNAEIDSWVEQMVSEDTFLLSLKKYLQEKQMLEDLQSSEYMDTTGHTD